MAKRTKGSAAVAEVVDVSEEVAAFEERHEAIAAEIAQGARRTDGRIEPGAAVDGEAIDAAPIGVSGETVGCSECGTVSIHGRPAKLIGGLCGSCRRAAGEAPQFATGGVVDASPVLVGETPLEDTAHVPAADAPPAFDGTAGGDSGGAGAMAEIPLVQVHPSTFNARRDFDAAQLQELADSIGEYGLLQPIIVRPDEGGGYEIVDGERRYRASKLAGKRTICAVVRVTDDLMSRKVSLIANLRRQGLNAIEEARGYQELRDNFGLSDDDIAASVNGSRPGVANARRLLGLPPAVLAMVERGELSPTHGRALLRFAKWAPVCEKVAELATKEKWESKTLEGGLPGAYELENKGLVKNMGYYKASFPECKACPFDAYFVAGNHYCIQPEHWRELHRESEIAEGERVKCALASQEAAKQRAIDASAKAKGAPADVSESAAEPEKAIALADIGAIPGAKVLTASTERPAGCSPDCACDVIGKLRGATVEACIDEKRWNLLTGRDKRASNKALRAELQGVTVKLDAALHRGELGAESTALITSLALERIHHNAWYREAIKLTMYKPIGKVTFDTYTAAGKRKALEAVAALEPMLVARFIAGCLAGEELKSSIEHASPAPMAQWLAGQLAGEDVSAAPEGAADSDGAVAETAEPAAASGDGLRCRVCGTSDRVSSWFGVCSAHEPDPTTYDWALWWLVFRKGQYLECWNSIYQTGADDQSIAAILGIVFAAEGEGIQGFPSAKTDIHWGMQGEAIRVSFRSDTLRFVHLGDDVVSDVRGALDILRPGDVRPAYVAPVAETNDVADAAEGAVA